MTKVSPAVVVGELADEVEEFEDVEGIRSCVSAFISSFSVDDEDEGRGEIWNNQKNYNEMHSHNNFFRYFWIW